MVSGPDLPALHIIALLLGMTHGEGLPGQNPFQDKVLKRSCLESTGSRKPMAPGFEARSRTTHRRGYSRSPPPGGPAIGVEEAWRLPTSRFHGDWISVCAPCRHWSRILSYAHFRGRSSGSNSVTTVTSNPWDQEVRHGCKEIIAVHIEEDTVDGFELKSLSCTLTSSTSA